MANDYAVCEYHGRFKMTEWNDWQCPKCHKEIMDYGMWRGHGKALTRDAKNLLKRTGVLK